VKMLLERAKGSPLDIFTGYKDSADVISLLIPRTQQIRHLNFTNSYWVDVQTFSQVNSGSFPLLHTLEINVSTSFLLGGSFDYRIPPSVPLFRNAANLKQFILRSEGLPFLSLFVFPNITTFELWINPTEEEYLFSELLNFLEASPTLETVHMQIAPLIVPDDIAQTKVVILPNVQKFSLVVDDGEPDYELASRISCPSARHTSLIYKVDAEDIVFGQYLFPTAASWNNIVRQYTKSPVEAVTLDINPSHDPIVACTLTFKSSDASVIKLELEVSGDVDDEDDFEMTVEDILLKIFQDYPGSPTSARCQASSHRR